MNPNFLQKLLMLVSLSIGISVAFAQDYDTLSKIEEKIREIAKKSGGSATASPLFNSEGRIEVVLSVDKEDKDKDILSDRNILLLKIAKPSKVPDKERANILITGTQHAGEWVAYVVVLNTAEFILQNKDKTDWPKEERFDYLRKFKDLTIKNLTDSATIYLVPVANPAGYQFSRVDVEDNKLAPDILSWRKNRRDVSGDPKDDSEKPALAGDEFIGVDLNRNYPTKNPPWGTITNSKGKETTSRTRYSDVYCGRPRGLEGWKQKILNPSLERESGVIVNLVTFPGRTWAGYIDVHSFIGLVGSVQTPDPKNANLRPKSSLDDKTIYDLLEKQAAGMIIDPVDTKPYRPGSPYPASGTTREWFYEQTKMKAFGFLIEVGNRSTNKADVGKFGYRPPAPQRHADAVLPGMLFLMFAMVDKEFSSRPFADFKKP